MPSLRFGNPPSPRGGRLNRLRTHCHFERQSRNPPRKKRHVTCPRQPTCPQWLTAEKSPAIETKIIIHPLPQTLARSGSLPRQPTCPQWLTADKTSAVETKAIIHPLPQTLARRGSLPRQPTCSQGLPAAKKEADETSASVNRCPVCPNPTRRVENQAYVYEFFRDFADIVMIVESYLITPSLMVREKRSLRPRRISSGITRALCPRAST